MKKALLIVAILAVLGGIGYVGLNLAKTDQADPTAGQDANEKSGNVSLEETEQDETNIELTDADKQHLGDANRGKTVDATDQTEVTLTMSDFRFDTTYLRIKTGTKVTWVNDGDTGHDVTPSPSSPDTFEGSELLASGDSFELTFDQAGKYYYFCTPHSSQMRAIIEVIE